MLTVRKKPTIEKAGTWVYTEPRWWWLRDRGGLLEIKLPYMRFTLWQIRTSLGNIGRQRWSNIKLDTVIEHRLEEYVDGMELNFKFLRIAFKRPGDAVQFKMIFSDMLQQIEECVTT